MRSAKACMFNTQHYILVRNKPQRNRRAVMKINYSRPGTAAGSIDYEEYVLLPARREALDQSRNS